MNNNLNEISLNQILYYAVTNAEGTPHDAVIAQMNAFRDWFFPIENRRPVLVNAGIRWDERERLREILNAEINKAKNK